MKSIEITIMVNVNDNSPIQDVIDDIDIDLYSDNDIEIVDIKGKIVDELQISKEH